MLLKRRFAVVFVLAALLLPIAGCGDDIIDPTQNFLNPSIIRVRNNLEGAILFFHVRTCGTTDFGEDLLPLDPLTGVISVGTSKDFTVEAGCYDLNAKHLEGDMPGPVFDKFLFDVNASPIAAVTWNVEEMNGPT